AAALLTVSRSVPVLDDPRRAHFAVAPLLALDVLAAAGLAVQRWDLVAERPAHDTSGRVWMDPTGPDLVHEARSPGSGEPAWSPEPFEGELITVLAVGGEPVGARRHASLAARRAGEHDGLLRPEELPGLAAELARRAQRTLGVSSLEVDRRAGEAAAGESAPPAIVQVVAGPDLDRWDQDLEGNVAAAIAALLQTRIETPR